MSVDFNDLALLPCISVFGDSATYIPGGGARIALTGIFNEFATLEQIDKDSGSMVTVTRPIITIRQSDITSGQTPVYGEGVIAAGRTWTITEVLPDGLGALVLKLMRAQTS